MGRKTTKKEYTCLYKNHLDTDQTTYRRLTCRFLNPIEAKKCAEALVKKNNVADSIVEFIAFETRTLRCGRKAKA